MNHISGKSLPFKISILILLTILVIAVLWTICWGRGSLDGVIVDSVTSKPISGALVVVSYPTIQGDFMNSIGSGHVYASEGYTDAQGGFHAKGWWPSLFCGEGAILRDKPQIIGIKEGYQFTIVKDTEVQLINERYGDAKTQQGDHTLRIAMVPMNPTEAEKFLELNNLNSAVNDMSMHRDESHDCWWKPLPNLKRFLEINGRSIATEGQRSRCRN